MFVFFIVLLTIFILLEGTVTALPLALLFLLCLTIVKKEAIIFPVAFFSGLLLDILKIQIVGERSIFFLIFIFFVLLYQRKYEINSYPFVAVAGFFGALIYCWVFGYGNILVIALISSLIALLFFGLLRLSFLRRQESGYRNL